MLLINWAFEAFIQVHTVLWSKQVVTELTEYEKDKKLMDHSWH